MHAEECCGDTLQDQLLLGWLHSQVSAGACGSLIRAHPGVMALHGWWYDGGLLRALECPSIPVNLVPLGTQSVVPGSKERHALPKHMPLMLQGIAAPLQTLGRTAEDAGVHKTILAHRVLFVQVVCSSLRREKGREVVMFWYLESIEVSEKPHGLFGRRQAPLLKYCDLLAIHACSPARANHPSVIYTISLGEVEVLAASFICSFVRIYTGLVYLAGRSGSAKISADQKRVHRATKKDNAYLQVHCCRASSLPWGCQKAPCLRQSLNCPQSPCLVNMQAMSADFRQSWQLATLCHFPSTASKNAVWCSTWARTPQSGRRLRISTCRNGRREAQR